MDQTSKYGEEDDEYDEEEDSEDSEDENGNQKQGDETRLEIEEINMEYDRQLNEMYKKQRQVAQAK